MAVTDRWHKSRPGKDEEPCREHGKVPTADHGEGYRWQVRWRDNAGRQRKENFEKRAAADDRDTAVKNALKAGDYIDPQAGKITFREKAEQWRTSRTHDLATARRIKSEFENHVYAAPETPGRTPKGGLAIGDHQIRALAKQPSVMQEWIKGLKLHPNTARQVILDVGQVFVAAVDDSLIPRNPLSARSVQRPKRTKREVTAWTYEQVSAVSAAMPDGLAVMVDLGASCGHRQHELCAVAAGDINFLRKMIHIDTQVKYVGGCLVFAPVKNGKERDVPIADPVIPGLAEHVRLHPPMEITLPWRTPDGKPVTRRLIFHRQDGKPHYRNTVNKPWQRAWKKAGIEEAERINGMHILRHTAASVWLSAGLSLAKVAAYLGDTKAIVLETYAHFMPDDDDRAREIMNAFFAAAADTACALNAPAGPAGLVTDTRS